MENKKQTTNKTRKKRGYWTEKRVRKEAQKYAKKTQFWNGSRGAFRAAIRLNIMEELFPINRVVRGYYTNEKNLLKTMGKYPTRLQLFKGAPGAYAAAFKQIDGKIPWIDIFYHDMRYTATKERLEYNENIADNMNEYGEYM